jgi:hypothetical protein
MCRRTLARANSCAQFARADSRAHNWARAHMVAGTLARAKLRAHICARANVRARAQPPGIPASCSRCCGVRGVSPPPTVRDGSAATLRDGSAATVRDGSAATLRGGSAATVRDGSAATVRDGSAATLPHRRAPPPLGRKWHFFEMQPNPVDQFRFGAQGG